MTKIDHVAYQSMRFDEAPQNNDTIHCACKSPVGPDFGPGSGPAGSNLTSLNRTLGKGRTQSLSPKDRAGTGHEAKLRRILEGWVGCRVRGQGKARV